MFGVAKCIFFSSRGVRKIKTRSAIAKMPTLSYTREENSFCKGMRLTPPPAGRPVGRPPPAPGVSPAGIYHLSKAEMQQILLVIAGACH